jgi:signal transduction histidine kinase
MLLSQSARQELPVGSLAYQELALVTGAAEQLTRTMDEIVWAVDPKRDSLESLVTYVGSAAQELLSAAGIRFRFEAPNDPPDWTLSADCRHSLFLAFKEALHNVVRHANAQMVKVSFEVGDKSFMLSVEDDGSGFDLAHPVSRERGGRGLGNLERRLLEIGGSCEIESQSGVGTRVVFRMPLDGSNVTSKR